ncbi:rho family-interacting cell polarization regulator 1-like [Anneissia japonica]|uniref:rho family-interacting cell polarization regulator 1-like n=1 Tax=Anneissia japonica TaxID=1529436 RepID=UPI0014256EE8|nr:rho family-interacting cell polarization regulator 1-like [Anneissia japonica]
METLEYDDNLPTPCSSGSIKYQHLRNWNKRISREQHEIDALRRMSYNPNNLRKAESLNSINSMSSVESLPADLKDNRCSVDFDMLADANPVDLQFHSTPQMAKNIRGFASPPVQRRLKSKKPMRMHQLGRNIHKIMPRIPRPQRTQVILDSLKNGLKVVTLALTIGLPLCYLAFKTLKRWPLQYMELIRHSVVYTIVLNYNIFYFFKQGFHYNLDKQIKSRERYIRKLQFHLTKVEELQEHYEKELKVREGAVNMVRAYSDHARKKKEPVNEAKSGVKDCTQALCYMEAELEANLGMFLIKIEGIAGFARVCRGDVFEITFKYGQQKWKSKCKVEKDLSQSWEHDDVVLFPLIGEFLTVKVTEIRGIGRSNVVIGNLEFDTSDFYQAESQSLTIDVNENGTIKMNMNVTWCPFQATDEEQVRSPKGSYGKRERSFTESSGGHPSSTNQRSLSMEERVISQGTNRPKSRHFDMHTAPILTLEEALHNVCRLLEILNGQYMELKDLDMQVSNLDTILKKKTEDIKIEKESSMSIKNALDSFDFLDDIDEGSSDPYDVDSSDDSINEESPESAVETEMNNSDEITKLECNKSNINETDASLLNKQNSLTDSNDKDNKQNKIDKNRNSCHSTNIHTNHADITSNGTGKEDFPLPMDKTNKLSAWSGQRESLFMEFMEKRDSWLFDGNFRASRLFEMSEQRECRLIDACDDAIGKSSMSLAYLTTGDDGIDQTLVQHLQFIEYLLTHLGAFGPLKVKETIALEKLQKQASILLQLNTLVDKKTKVSTPEDVYPDLKLNPDLVSFWECCSEKEVLYVNTDSFLLHLDVKFGAKLRTNHPDIADRVFQNLTQQIIERPVNLLNPKTVMTLFQYVSFFMEDERKNPEKYVADITNEYELTANLHPANPDLPKVLKKLPKGVLLPAGNLQALGILLLESSATFQTGVRMYLESINQNDQIRQKAINIFLECLEERDQSMRQAGCAALAAMKASEALDQLVYLLRCDVDDVKTTAKEALEAFGDEGHEAFERVAFPYFGSSVAHYPVDVPLMTTEL